ncbi:MAG: hypothetical protein MJH08_15580 [Hyphomicrobiales bacterium]|nr:hypothetical protein [Hyphomicrobiales bacterium]
MPIDAEHLIDLDRYPIHQPGPELDALLANIRSSLDDDGCAVLKGFVRPEGIAMLTEEAESVRDNGHRSYNRTNPYFTKDDPSLPEDDPRRAFFDRSNNFIPADNFQSNGPLRRLHDFPAFDPFIQACMEQQEFHRYADPLADVIINMAEEGEGFPWHFDTNNFTVTLAIQNAEAGGEFEYAPNIRSSGDGDGDGGGSGGVDDGENFPEVRRVLDGTSDKIVKLVLEPGDLQLFKGRYSLHRVAPLKGPTPRYVAIFSYVEEPNMVGAPERTRQLYGKVLPIHLERAGQRADAYID